MFYCYNSKSNNFNLVCDIVVPITKTSSFILKQFHFNSNSQQQQEKAQQLIKSVVETNKLVLIREEYEKIRFPVLGIDILSAYGEIT